jgi:hypothetical protein
MADNYLEFSEVLAHLSPQEEAWLREQLEFVYVVGEQEYTQDTLPADLDPEKADWQGCRAWRDLPDCEEDGEIGFHYEFHDDHRTADSWGRHLWFCTDGWGDPWRVAHPVQKFLKQFRPKDSWSITYAISCSKPRVSEFGGGGIFVTAAETKAYDAHDLVQDAARQFAAKEGPSAVAKLVERAGQHALAEDALDDAVHEAISAQAAAINNGGTPRQLAFLIEQWGAAETERLLTGLFHEAPQ